MEDSDIVFLGFQNGLVRSSDDVLPPDYFEQETLRRFSPQTIQANVQHDRNNNTDFTQASASNGIQTSRLDNIYPHGASSRQDNRYPSAGVHVNIFGNMLQATTNNNFHLLDEFPQVTDATAYVGPYNIFRSLPDIFPFHPLVNSNPDHHHAHSNTTSIPGPRLYPQPSFPMQTPAASTSSEEPNQLNHTSGDLRNHHAPYREPPEPVPRRIKTPGPIPNLQPSFLIQAPAASTSSQETNQLNHTPMDLRNHHVHYREAPEPVQRRINPSRKVKSATHAAIGSDVANHVPPNVPSHRALSLKTKAKTQIGRPSKIQKVAEPQQVNPGVARQGSSYHHLLSLDATNLVASTEDARCPACLLWVLAGEGVVLKDCLHSFCRECLQDAILHSETAQVRCPFANEEYACESHLQEREIKCLVSTEEYEKYLGRSMSQAKNQASNAFLCRTPDCTGWCLFEVGVREFLCPVCHHTNCLTCWSIHEGTDCKDNLRAMFSQDSRADVSQPMDGAEPRSEEGQNYQNLLVLSDMGLVTNKERFDCPICFSDIKVGEGVTLKDCLHNYCRECLTGTVRHSETVLVKCPFVNDEYSCESYLQEREIKWLVTTEEYERHLARSVALVESQSKNSFHCKTPDCPGWCLFEDDVNWFFCDVCSQTNCLTCAAIHEGKNCKQYQDWLSFQSDTSKEARKTREYLEKQVKSNRAMECPTCKVIVMKRDGCDWLSCSMCRTDICWATRGPRWGPKGRGDTSGGCKCDFRNGRLCHPKCGNCH